MDAYRFLPPSSFSTPIAASMFVFASITLSTLAFSLFAPSAHAQQTVIVTRRRSIGSIIAGCVVGTHLRYPLLFMQLQGTPFLSQGGLVFLAICAMCCTMARRRQTRSGGGPSIEDPYDPNFNTGATGSGTRIVAVHSRPMFWGRRRGLFRGPRVIAMSSWSANPAYQQQQQRAPAPTPPGDISKAENTEFGAPAGVTPPPPPYAGDSMVRRRDYVHHDDSEYFLGKRSKGRERRIICYGTSCTQVTIRLDLTHS